MKNSLRTLAGISALALLLVATPVLAAEVTVTGDNSTTGADSTNENTHDIDNNIDMTVDNDGDVDNTADADVTTGDNEQSRNTTGGDLESGAVDASTDWESIVNAGAELMDSDEEFVIDADFGNDTTGADSDNTNELDVDHNIDLDLDNMADILNDLDLDANTGDNEQTRNTEAGDLMSGDVEVDSVIGNWANNDGGMAAGMASVTDISFTAENHLTGADSTNENTVDVDNDLDIDVDNDADIDTTVDVDANTGGNTQNRNTTAGSLETGSVVVGTDVVNVANAGAGSNHGGSSLNLDVEASNDTTGADSDNTNEVTVSNDVDVDVDNDADIDNDLDVDANTGDNEQSRNTEGGDIVTGGVSIQFNVVNEAN